MAGPSVMLGYAIAGIIAFMIMRQLGEMVVDEPVAGSFSHFANKYCGDFAGFLSGWNYWVLYILVSMAELTAVGIYVQYWWPGVPTWISALVCFAVINAINLTSVKSYGEMEFWFAIIKVVAVIGMILFGGYLLISRHGRSRGERSPTSGSDGGFFPHGLRRARHGDGRDHVLVRRAGTGRHHGGGSGRSVRRAFRARPTR